MKQFFGDDVLLSNESANQIYNEIKDLPIIDYHCHLDEKKIAENATFDNIGELWLAGDHYKWRAMRLCGVDEHYITGKATYKQKFLKYAEIMPNLVGNPLYFWTHLELKKIFGIDLPLSAQNAETVWNRANKVLKNLRVRDLLSQFRVQYIATTDDPISDLVAHGKYDNTLVAPTFRPDKLLAMDEEYLIKLGNPKSLAELKAVVRQRLDFFQSKGGKIADVGFDFIPDSGVTEQEAENILSNRIVGKRDKYFSYMLGFIAAELTKRKMLLQLHFGTFRNVNTELYSCCGADSGLDVMRSYVDVDKLASLLNEWNSRKCLPTTILYPLNDSALRPLTTLSGAFRNVYIGAAWWFNDTAQGIRRQLETVAEYGALGTNFGMLTDSRSFSSYVRFDFFRRILADFLGGYVERGEYTLDQAKEVAKNISYFNIKKALEL